MGSSRFPNKPLTKILGIPMLGHVALRCKLEPIFDDVIVATCDEEIMRYCESIGVTSLMTSDKHERASDRIQEATEIFERQKSVRFKSVTMVQGDEPMVTPKMLKTAVDALEKTNCKIVNLMSVIKDKEEYNSLNCVKVVTSSSGNALFFSRAPIPTATRLPDRFPKAYKQVCVIPFQRDFLDTYTKLKPTYLEEVESVDMNRVIEHDFQVFCAEIDEESYPVDVPQDAIRVEAFLKNDPLLRRYL
jgi:3-deoxy-manno-octulosonate cytidylyltransferase (CMP-KDO synthetase)